jgi:hypothetical protein
MHQSCLWSPSGTELPVPIVGAAPGVPSHTRLSNLSSRGDVQDGDRIMIAGFVVAGEGTHRVLLRAVGPGLAGMVEAHAADTILRLVRSSDGTPVAANDDWHADATRIEEATTQVGALPLPEASKDAAMLIDLPAGSYTVLVDAVPGRGRVAIAEVYSVSHDASGDARLVNLSTRAVVGTGEEILIPGFVAAGDLPRRILLRAVGPTLRADLGDAALADPVLRVYTGESGRLVAENDDWHTSPTADIVREIADRVGAFALEADGRDAALVLTVPPNTGYTIHVSGKDGSTGIVLAEIYEVP